MFNNRKNFQKPHDELISQFKKTFSDIVPSTQSGSNDRLLDAKKNDLEPGKSELKLKDSLTFPNNDTPEQPALNTHDLDRTPSWMGLDSFPTFPPAHLYPGRMGAKYHNEAGDLHTPSGMHVKNFASLPNTFHTPYQYSHSNGFEPFNSQFTAKDVHGSNLDMQLASFAPGAFMHRDSGYNNMEDFTDGLFLDGSKVETSSNATPSLDLLPLAGDDILNARDEKFRYHVSLHAPTAMIDTSGEMPVTYLNKGQPYNISVVDSNPPLASDRQILYRTVIRVSFDEDEQRLNPSASWTLWKEARGLTEAQRRDGKLLAVEYVNPVQGTDGVQLESNFVDGFAFTWTPTTATKTSGCDIFVRFNFLSTDFSHSKGVRGVSVKLCAKTELLSPGEESGILREKEVSYCKVKLFRDHGAERKQTNDIAHVNKTIDKLNQQVAEAEVGGGFAKRRRCNDDSDIAKSSDRSTNIGKHGHTSSMDTSSKRVSLEDSLRSKLGCTQDMLSSSRQVSVFNLRCEQVDDPDLYPIHLPGSAEHVICKNTNRSNEGDLQPAVSGIPSPPSTRVTSSTPQPPQAIELTNGPTTIQKNQSCDEVARGSLEAVGVDSTYVPPVEHPSKAIACLYVRLNETNQQPQGYYKAIYLSERTVRALIDSIAEKYSIDLIRVAHIVYVNERGIRVKFDDDMVRQLPEGQDMIMEINEAPDSDGIQGGVYASPLEIKLTF